MCGAGDGGAVRELLKYNAIERIDLVELDSMVTCLAKTHPVFLGMNKGAVNSPKVRVFNVDAFNYVDTTTQFYDLIIADFPDPRNVDLAKLYSKEFYAMCGSHLSPNGVLITQAGSPFYTTIANFCIEKTISAAGYNAIPMHQHVYSFGEWGWILASKSLSKNEIKNKISSVKVKPETRMFGQLGIQERLLIPNVPLIGFDSSEVEVSTLYNPVVYRYYLQGDWSYEL